MRAHTFARLSPLLLLALAGCFWFPPGGYYLSRTDQLVGVVAAENDGPLGQYARGVATGDWSGNIDLAREDGVVAALVIIGSLDPRVAWEGLVEISTALAQTADLEGARLAMETALDGILRPGLGANCPAGLWGVRCRLEVPELPGFAKGSALEGIAQAATAAGYGAIAERARAALAETGAEGSPSVEGDGAQEVEARADAAAGLLDAAEALAYRGDAAGGAGLAKAALPAIRELEEPSARAWGLLGAARLILAAGEAEEGVRLAQAAGRLARRVGIDEPGWWELSLAVARVLWDTGEVFLAERLIALVVGRVADTPRELAHEESLGWARRQHRVVNGLSAAGWHRQAIELASMIRDPAQSQLALANTALAVRRDQGLEQSGRRALLGHFLRALQSWFPTSPDRQWREGAEEDHLLVAMYAASAVTGTGWRRDTYVVVLGPLLDAKRHDLVAAAVAELEALEAVWGPRMWEEEELATVALRLPGRRGEGALAILETAVAQARLRGRPKERMDELWEIAGRVEAVGLPDLAEELRAEVAEQAMGAPAPRRDSLLYWAAKGFAGRGETELAEALAGAIGAETWRTRAGTHLALARARAGDWDEVWDHQPNISAPMLRMELLEGAALAVESAGEGAATTAALARLEVLLEEAEVAAVMRVEARMALAWAHLAAGSIERATLHYELAAMASSSQLENRKATHALPLAVLARALGRAEEANAYIAQVREASRWGRNARLGRRMAEMGMWEDALDLATEMGTDGWEVRDDMLYLLAFMAATIGQDPGVDEAEREAILARILDLVDQ
ncbi:hypothetical protein IIA16_00390 [bacterium]|nr:hypothetical protein [bacterium]